MRLEGLRDAHLHIAEHGEELSCVRLSDCASQGECLERLAAAVGPRAEDDPGGTAGLASGGGGWVRAVGARVEAWPERAWPTAEQIDEATGGVPAVVVSFDHHALVAGGAALRAAGVTRDTPDPPRGIIERRDGRPTGLLLEEAMLTVYRAMPAPSEEALRGFVRAAVEDLARRGFTEVHEMCARPEVARALLDMERRGRLPMDVALYARREHFDALVEMSARWESERVRLAGLKIFTDGTLNSRTALMLHPYEEPIPGLERGKAVMSPAEVEEAVRFADALGYPVAAHAIGDGAVRMVLDAVERAAPASYGQRIEHAQFIDEADIDRFASLGVVASVQPCHLLTDIEAVERLTPRRAGRAFPLRDLVQAAQSAGFEPQDLVWMGSDAPIVPPAPEDNIRAAVHRRRAGMDPSRAVGMDQAIDEQTVLRCSRSAATEHAGG